jgi:hypothetical protein
MTEKMLGAPEIAEYLKCGFEIDESETKGGGAHGLGQPPHYEIRMWNGIFKSQIYADEARFARDPTGFVGPFSDYGLLAKFPRPDGRDGTVFVAAGVGALGTWGAGLFLQENLLQMGQLVLDDDFAALVYSEREYGKGSLPQPMLEKLQVVVNGTLTGIDVAQSEFNSDR